MLNVILFIGSLLTIFLPGSDIYQMHFKSFNKGMINMPIFRGKQLLIAVFDANDPDIKLLRSLDTLYQDRKGQLEIIAIPLMDIGNGIQRSDLKSVLMDSLSVHYKVADTSYAKDMNGNLQHPLLKWATHKNFNNHFDQQVKRDGEIFIISSAGDLYAKLNTEIIPTGKTMQRVLDNQPVR